MKKKLLAITAAVAIGLLWWHSAQPDPPDVRFLSSVHKWSPETRAVTDDSLLNYGYDMCSTLTMKGIDGLRDKTVADLAAGVTYAGSVRESALDNLCPPAP